MDILQTESKTLRGFLNRHVTGIDIAASIVIVLLVMTNVFAYTSYTQLQTEYLAVKSKEVALRTNEAVLGFTKLFIDKVLKADGEIDFETRIMLESSVRAVDDQEVLKAWQAFTSSENEQEAQRGVKELLSVLISRVQ